MEPRPVAVRDEVKATTASIRLVRAEDVALPTPAAGRGSVARRVVLAKPKTAPAATAATTTSSITLADAPLALPKRKFVSSENEFKQESDEGKETERRRSSSRLSLATGDVHPVALAERRRSSSLRAPLAPSEGESKEEEEEPPAPPSLPPSRRTSAMPPPPPPAVNLDDDADAEDEPPPPPPPPDERDEPDEPDVPEPAINPLLARMAEEWRVAQAKATADATEKRQSLTRAAPISPPRRSSAPPTSVPGSASATTPEQDARAKARASAGRRAQQKSIRWAPDDDLVKETRVKTMYTFSESQLRWRRRKEWLLDLFPCTQWAMEARAKAAQEEADAAAAATAAQRGDDEE